MLRLGAKLPLTPVHNTHTFAHRLDIYPAVIITQLYIYTSTSPEQTPDMTAVYRLTDNQLVLVQL